MRTPFLHWLVIPAISLLCGSCELAELGEPILVSNIEKEFTIDLWEKLGPQQRTLQLRVNTIREESCQNARIDYLLSQVNNTIQVSLRKILTPADCISGQAPARAVIDMGAMPAGLYELNIDLKSEVFNNGQLSVLGDRYVINMRSRNGFTLANTELRRVPDQTIWGYVAYSSLDDEETAKKFVLELESISQARAFAPGNYGYFQVQEDGSRVVVTDHPQTARIGQFLYGYEGGKQALQTLVDTYRSRYKDKLNIRLYTSLGDDI